MPQAVLASEPVSLAPVGLVACILIMNENLSHCLSRCWRFCASGSELDEDAVKYNEVGPGKLISQFQCSLPLILEG